MSATNRANGAPTEVEEYVPLGVRTTLGVGGNARYFAQVSQREQFERVVSWARVAGVPILLLGGGSNVVISDRGFDGLVLKIASSNIEFDTHRDGARVFASAGACWHTLVERACERELSGVECLAGIPGDVGATPIQNVGAYGQEVGDTLLQVEAFDLVTMSMHTFTREACQLGYRDSVFKRSKPGRWAVWSVALELSAAPPQPPTYAELTQYLREANLPNHPQALSRAVTQLRRAKSMVVDPSDPNAKSAGSFFINPIVPQAVFDDVARTVGSAPPGFFQPDGRVKVPAAWLIERAGFAKGTSLGRVGLSTKHALAIVNLGGATAAEVLTFATTIRDHVAQNFGIRLMPEVQFVGFSTADLLPLTGVPS